MSVLQIASALAFVHTYKVIHGDLTASNVLLSSTPAQSGSGRSFTTKVCHQDGSYVSRIPQDALLTPERIATSQDALLIPKIVHGL